MKGRTPYPVFKAEIQPKRRTRKPSNKKKVKKAASDLTSVGPGVR